LRQILLDVDYALNVKDNGDARPDALVAHLRVPPELRDGRPWDKLVHKELEQHLAGAVESARAADAARAAAAHAAAGGQAGYRQPSHGTPATTRAAKRRSEGGEGGS
jgi:hypothetical protein